MRQDTALKAITALGSAGVLFSGYLTYLEFYGAQTTSCPALGAPGTVLGQPPCLYGLVMYSAVLAVAIVGLSVKREA